MKTTKINYKCQVFTPENYVKELLDSVGYLNNILDKTILENSCGDGNILIEIVKRYIDEAKKNNYTHEQIKIGLEHHIYGFEIDKQQFQKCINNLNDIVRYNGIQEINWNVYNKDYLKSNPKIKFDFIVGNPPYITYKELPLEERKMIKENYMTCRQGKFDYCYAFIEHSIKSLSDRGKMAYLIPSSIFKTVFGNHLRTLMKPIIYKIKDYTKERIFDEVLVKSAIILIDKSYEGEQFRYLDMNSNQEVHILKQYLNDKWVFTTENLNNGSKRFGDYFSVSNVVATLLNEAYVLDEKEYKETKKYYCVGDIKIEKEVVMDSASPRKIRSQKKEKIIFPYHYEDKLLIKIDEQQFRKLYPGAFNYLMQFKKKLQLRKADQNAKWFEYGRSQALKGIRCEKLLLSTIITDKVYVYKLGENCIPYAGLYISLKEHNTSYNLDFAKKILESKAFIDYVRQIGINISGTSMRITSKDIENFRF